MMGTPLTSVTSRRYVGDTLDKKTTCRRRDWLGRARQIRRRITTRRGPHLAAMPLPPSPCCARSPCRNTHSNVAGDHFWMNYVGVVHRLGTKASLAIAMAWLGWITPFGTGDAEASQLASNQALLASRG